MNEWIIWIIQVFLVSSILAIYGLVMQEIGMRRGFRYGCRDERDFNYRRKITATRYRDRRRNFGLHGDN
jgi:hypothetical protein